MNAAEKVFVNHTNHASANWSAAQRSAAEKFGRIVDFLFPEIPPSFTAEEVRSTVLKNLQEILRLEPTAVLCQGEFSYTVAMVEELKKNKIPALAATSARAVSEIVEADGSTKKVSIFQFVQFRPY